MEYSLSLPIYYILKPGNKISFLRLGNYMKTTVKSILSMSNYQNSMRKK